MYLAAWDQEQLPEGGGTGLGLAEQAARGGRALHVEREEHEQRTRSRGAAEAAPRWDRKGSCRRGVNDRWAGPD